MSFIDSYNPHLLDGVQHVHFIGCGGSGTYPLIQILHSRGLTISGSGEAPVFQSADDQPWAAVRDQITEVWFEDVETLTIPDLAYWFEDCVNLTTAELPPWSAA